MQVVDDDRPPFRETILRAPPRRYGSKLLGRAASLFAKRQTWTNGRTLRIHFADGSPPQLVEAFQRFLREDLPPLGIAFEYTDDRRIAHIRVAFDPNMDGGGSYVGTAATDVPNSQPTMILGTRSVTRYVVLHEFGHALGLRHEHQHPDSGIRWDMDGIRRTMPGWDDRLIRSEITDRYSRSDPRVGAGPYDEDSVMMYDIPPVWTQGGCCAKRKNLVHSSLSAEDKARLQKLYPPPSADSPPPPTDSRPPPPPPPHSPRVPLAVYEWVFWLFCALASLVLALLARLVALRARRAYLFRARASKALSSLS